MERDRRGSLSSVASTATTGTSDSSSSGGGVANKVGNKLSSVMWKSFLMHYGNSGFSVEPKETDKDIWW